MQSHTIDGNWRLHTPEQAPEFDDLFDQGLPGEAGMHHPHLEKRERTCLKVSEKANGHVVKPDPGRP